MTTVQRTKDNQVDEVDWIQTVQDQCIECSRLYTSPQELIRANEAQEENSLPVTTDEDNTPRRNGKVTIDEALECLSSSCIILSCTNSIKEREAEIRRKRSHCQLISFRKSNTHKNIAHNSSCNKQQDSSFWEAFSLLTISNNETKSKQNNNNEYDDQDETLIKMGSELIASLIHDKTISSNLPSTNIETTADTETKINSQLKSPSRLLLGLPKSIMSHTYSTVTSILTRYDLMEQDIQVSDDNNNMDGCDEDDAFGTSSHEDIYAFTDHDDAHVNNDNTAVHKSAALPPPPPSLREMDTIWSTELIIDCWRIITSHIKHILESQEELHGFTITHTNDGILLNRKGNDSKSFLHFCREAVKKSHSTTSTTTTTTNMNTPPSRVKTIVSNLTTGFTLELLLMILIHTNSASLSPDGTVLCLFQPQSITCTNSSNNTEQSHHPSPASPLHEADIAEFKLVIAIESLERRINTLTTKAQDYANQAISAKKKQAANHQSKVAVMHMKRRMILLSEIETCSSSLLNLETTYHAIQRARNDAQVMRTFEVVNDALKQVRSELDGVGDVEEITGALRSNIQGVEEVHEGLFGGNLGMNSDETNDMKELEAELELLVSEESVDPLPVESGGAYSDVSLVAKENDILEYSTSAKKVLQETGMPAVKDNDAIITRIDGPVDDSSGKQKKIAQ